MLPIQHQIDYEIPWDTDFWTARIERACKALEELFPGEHLFLAKPYDRSGRLPDTVLSDRKAYLARQLRSKTRWFSIDNGKHIVGNGCTGWKDEGHIGVGGKMSAAAEGLFSFSVIFRLSPWRICENVLATVGDALNAYTAQLSPPETSMTLQRVQWRQGPREEIPALELPALRFSCYGGLDHPAQPHMLGWLNYWSAATCEYLGFPDTIKDQEIVSRSYRTPAGAWLVRLCEEPLDLRRDEHVALLRAAYERFERVGVRG